MSSWNQTLIAGAEAYLTRRRYRKYRKKEKQKQKNQILDWIHAFLWAAGVVLLLNQYLFQAYQIPSGSMKDTLLISDRIFVNKLVYGPELVPGSLKINGPIQPEKGEVIIFENPSYVSRGPVFDIAQRLIYMLTFSFVDIDKDENGNPKPHFLIKRAAGADGEWIRLDDGRLLVRAPGTSEWMSEEALARDLGTPYKVRKMIDPREYGYQRSARWNGFLSSRGLPFTEADWAASKNPVSPLIDSYVLRKDTWEFRTVLDPADPRSRSFFQRWDLGYYVPRGWILPLGDNRDNSRDGREFGPIPKEKVLGRAMFKYWPWDRVGGIR